MKKGGEAEYQGMRLKAGNGHKLEEGTKITDFLVPILSWILL